MSKNTKGQAVEAEVILNEPSFSQTLLPELDTNYLCSVRSALDSVMSLSGSQVQHPQLSKRLARQVGNCLHNAGKATVWGWRQCANTITKMDGH